MTKLTRAQIDMELDKLAAWVPAMIESIEETEQMEAFARMAELVKEAAAPDDLPHVDDRIQRILSHNCMVPTDEGPCA